MIVLSPISITPDDVSTSTIDDTFSVDPPEWNSALSYVLNDLVSRPNNKIYRFLLEAPTVDSVTPEVSAVSSSPKWIEVGYINRLRPFNYMSNEAVVFSSPEGTADYTIVPTDRVDSIAFIGMENITSITIEHVDAEYTLIGQYYIDNISGVEDVGETGVIPTYRNRIITNIPPIYGSTFFIVFNTPNLPALGKISYIAMGIGDNIGTLQAGVAVDADNYSLITRNIYGDSSLTKRRNIARISGSVIANAELAGRLLQLRKSINAKPAVWAGLGDESDNYYDSLLVMGVYKAFRISVDNPITLTLDFTVEEI